MKIRAKIEEWIISLICSRVVIGGHCGLCGKWVPDVLVPRSWTWTVCEECVRDVCEHEWTDARNEVISSGEICLKCGSLRE